MESKDLDTCWSLRSRVRLTFSMGIALLIGLVPLTDLSAATGGLDATFGANGFVRQDVFGRDVVKSVATATDGSIFAAGYCNKQTAMSPEDHFCLAKFNADGSLATAFQGGYVFTQFGSISRVEHILVAGDKPTAVGYCTASTEYNHDFCIARYTASGTLDSTFNGSGVAKFDFGGGHDYPIAAVWDGNALLVVGSCIFASTGTSRFCALRVLDDGTLDQSFGTGGKVDLPAWQISGEPGNVFLRDNKIYVATACRPQYLMCALRLGPTGLPDDTFGSGGRVVSTTVVRDYGRYAATMTNNGIVIAAVCILPGTVRGCVTQIGLDGTLGGEFPLNANQTVSEFTGIASMGMSNGRIVLSGNCGEFKVCVARFDSNGAPDHSFGMAGLSNGAIPDNVQLSSMTLSGSGLLVGGTCLLPVFDF